MRRQGRHSTKASAKFIAFFFDHSASFLLPNNLPSGPPATPIFITTIPFPLLYHQTPPHHLTSQYGFREGYVFLSAADVIENLPSCHGLATSIELAHPEKASCLRSGIFVSNKQTLFEQFNGRFARVGSFATMGDAGGFLGFGS